MTQLASRINQVQNQIDQAMPNSPHGRIALLAVSKTRPVDEVKAAYDLGLRSFGENYVQEGVDKVIALRGLRDYSGIEWHFIGPIQSNKSRFVAEHFNWVHTIDREKIAKRLSEQRPNNLPSLNVLIQVNISHQDTKSGVALGEVTALADYITNLPNLTLRGLMCIPAPLNEDELTQEFAEMYKMYTALNAQYPQVDTLSMGMSGDLELAIKQGSTMVRIGTALFGPRTHPNAN